MAMTPAIFLDKDGTLLTDVPYNTDPKRMSFAVGALSGLMRLSTLGLPLIVISNQPGVALGKFSVDQLGLVREQLKLMFKLAGATLHGFYFCPHHPLGVNPQYTRLCDCRKPAPGLLHIAAQTRGIDLSRSWFVGDILDDIEAGRRAGCHTLLLDNGNETEWRKSEWRTPHRVEQDLDGAARWICGHFSRHASGALA